MPSSEAHGGAMQLAD